MKRLVRLWARIIVGVLWICVMGLAILALERVGWVALLALEEGER